MPLGLDYLKAQSGAELVAVMLHAANGIGDAVHNRLHVAHKDGGEVAIELQLASKIALLNTIGAILIVGWPNKNERANAARYLSHAIDIDRDAQYGLA